MSEHIPGPWYCHFATAVAEQADDDWQDAIGITTVDESSFIKDGGRGDLIAFVPWDTHWEANARLIAAAPELLAACRELVEWQSMDDPYASPHWMELATQIGAMAGQALRKAEGKA